MPPTYPAGRLRHILAAESGTFDEILSQNLLFPAYIA
jgi:hypothetical protein